MAQSGCDETWATARLPSLDVEIVHRRPLEGGDEQISMTLRTVPSFEAFGRFLEASHPLLFLDSSHGNDLVSLAQRSH